MDGYASEFCFLPLSPHPSDSCAYVRLVGGTAGLALHAPFRVATEHTVFAMPNMRYGYIAGGGVNYTLSRLDGQLGHYLSLTGFRLRHKAALWVS